MANKKYRQEVKHKRLKISSFSVSAVAKLYKNGGNCSDFVIFFLGVCQVGHTPAFSATVELIPFLLSEEGVEIEQIVVQRDIPHEWLKNSKV